MKRIRVNSRSHWPSTLVSVWMLAVATVVSLNSSAFCQIPGEVMAPPPTREAAPRSHLLPPTQRVEPYQRPMEAPTPITPQARERLRQYERLSPEEKAKLRGRLEEWKSLPSEERRSLRERLERWKRLSPTDRALLRERFEQWKTLRPEDRNRLRERLSRPEDLTPQEKEEIRERFRTH